MFQKEAEHWWKIVIKNAEDIGEVITWKFLVDKFTKKYIPRIARDKLALEFQELQQNQMTVTEYDNRFTQVLDMHKD